MKAALAVVLRQAKAQTYANVLVRIISYFRLHFQEKKNLLKHSFTFLLFFRCRKAERLVDERTKIQGSSLGCCVMIGGDV